MMTQTTASSLLGRAERPFTVRFSKPDSADRIELVHFISDIFHRNYGLHQNSGERIKHLNLYLMSLRDQNDQLIAACGLRSASFEKLHLESFLNQPIEVMLSEHGGTPVERGNIIEIDNFTVENLDMARYLVAAINDQLHFTSKYWAVFTSVLTVSDEFSKLGMHPIVLADADKSRLPAEEQEEWGSYFNQKPQVIAIRRMERRKNPRGT
ncbi:MAG: thermostable hemolysin [Gallionella sp.]